MQCQTCGLNLDPQQVAQTGRCPRCNTPVPTGAFGPPAGGSGGYPQAPGSGSYPQAPTYGQSPTVGGPPPYGGPSGAYGAVPPPSQPGWGAPQQGFPGGPPPQPGFGAPPPGFSGPPPQGFGGPPPQGFPGGPVAPPPRKSRTGLIVLIVVIVLVVVAGGTVAALALSKKPASTGSNNTPGTSASATARPGQPTATSTQPAVPSGFQTYSNSQFSVIYPSDWMKSQGTGQGSGIVFTSPTGQVFEAGEAGAASGGATPTLFDETYCSAIGMKTAGPTTVTIGGEQWTQETCVDSGSTLKSVVESVVHNNTLFLIAYASLAATFDISQSQFFTPMEQSFRFLS